MELLFKKKKKPPLIPPRFKGENVSVITTNGKYMFERGFKFNYRIRLLPMRGRELNIRLRPNVKKPNHLNFWR